MLVVMGGDLGSDFGAVGGGLLCGMQAVGVEHASKLHFELVCSIQGEGVIEAILVVGRSDDLRDDKFAITGRHHGSITEVGVLVEEPIILLVDADSVLDHSSFTTPSSQHTIHIVDSTLAVAAQL